MGSYWFTADEHYGHAKIIQPDYSDRPFTSVEEMDESLIANHNEMVGRGDCTVHIGDFSFYNAEQTRVIRKRLNGSHIFIRGSHDAWLKSSEGPKAKQIWTRKVHGQMICCCHYALRVWPQSHYGAWHLFGHSHGGLTEEHGKSFDVGVDDWNFYPVSFDQVKAWMDVLPNNFNHFPREVQE